MIIGVLGGGQLARMIAQAGYPLGLDFTFLDPSDQACASPVATQIKGAYDNRTRLLELAQQSDLVTYEFENVPAEAVEFLSDEITVYPDARALAVAQDRLNEKTLFRKLGIDTPPFAAVDSLESLEQAMEQVGWPAVVKTRTQGYDGKGQAVLRSPDDLAGAWESLGGAPAIVEGFINFDREISIIAARSTTGETVCYPISENTHREGILRLSIARPGDPIQALAEKYITQLLQELDYVGVLALELFQQGDKLLANECAPRVHNSGHWTQDGAETSQFENHLRAILGLPLGATSTLGHVAMINLIGDTPATEEILHHSHAHLHLYGKEPRPGRKIGHINLRAENEDVFQKELESLLALVDSKNT